MARTPSAEAHEKVLEAAIHLFGERGIEGTSMDAIAASSGVSKATVYKHWKDKDALCIDVFRTLRAAPPEFQTGHPRQDLLSLLTHFAHAGKPGRLLKILPAIIAYAAANPKFGQAFRKSSFGPTETQMLRILNDAVAAGELAAATDMELAVSLLFGPILHRKFMGGKVPPALPEQVIDSFWRGASAHR